MFNTRWHLSNIWTTVKTMNTFARSTKQFTARAVVGPGKTMNVHCGAYGAGTVTAPPNVLIEEINLLCLQNENETASQIQDPVRGKRDRLKTANTHTKIQAWQRGEMDRCQIQGREGTSINCWSMQRMCSCCAMEKKIRFRKE